MELPNHDEAAEDRLAYLEKTVAIQNRVGLVMLVGMLAILSIFWLATKPSKILTVDSLELRDKGGTLRCELRLDGDGTPNLFMYDHKGVKLVGLGQTYHGSSALSFYDEGDTRMQLSSISKGVSSLRFINDANETQSSLYNHPEVGLGLSFARGNDGLFFGFEQGGKPRLRLVDAGAMKEGRARLSPEELERFAAPAKVGSTDAGIPVVRETVEAKEPEPVVPAYKEGASASTVKPSTVQRVAFEREIKP